MFDTIKYSIRNLLVMMRADSLGNGLALRENPRILFNVFDRWFIPPNLHSNKVTHLFFPDVLLRSALFFDLF